MTAEYGGPVRIAMVGPAGSGKTTLARRCQKAWGGDVLSFATLLKKVTREVFGESMDDPNFARNANQKIGVTVRELDSQTWVRHLLAKVSPDRPCYVDDARFYNEYVALKQMGFVFARLMTDTDILRQRRPEMTDAQRLHQSEIESAYIPADSFVDTNDPDIEVAFRILLGHLDQLRPEWPVRKRVSHASSQA